MPGWRAPRPTRLVTRNAISLIYPLPMAYLPKIQAMPGMQAVVYGNWFGGIYIDEKQFFPVFAVDPVRRYFDIYPEYVMPEDQKQAFFQDRRGAAAGRALAQPLRLAAGGLHHPQGQHLSRGMAVHPAGHLYRGGSPPPTRAASIFTGNI